MNDVITLLESWSGINNEMDEEINKSRTAVSSSELETKLYTHIFVIDQI